MLPRSNVPSECLGNPFFKSVWWSQKWLKCNSGGVKKTKHRILFILSVGLSSVCVYHSLSCAQESVHLYGVYQKEYPYMQPAPSTPSQVDQSATLQTRPHFFPHLFIQACCFTGTSPCFVLFSPLFVFNCYRGGQLISLSPLSICSPHSCGTACLLAHLLPSPNATSLQMD